MTFSNAQWIWSSEATHAAPTNPSPSHYQVRLFRRVFDVDDTRDVSLIVRVSADSRYILFCNGSLVARGPAKGDVHHHFFDTVDLTRFLRCGENVLAAVVLDMSRVAHRPEHLGAPCSVMTYVGGFLLAGTLNIGGHSAEELSTGANWKVWNDSAYRFQNLNTKFEGYHGYFEHRIGADEPVGWTGPGYDDSSWTGATPLYPAELIEHRRDPASPYGLMPRIIPMLPESRPTRFAGIFREGGEPCEDTATALLSDTQDAQYIIPANTHVRLIVDAGTMTTAFPIVEVVGGTGARVELIYAEALRLPWGTEGAAILGKQQPLENLASHYADETTGWTFDRRGTISGWCDIWEPAGTGPSESFSPLHWRAFRYIGLRVTTGDAPITIRSFRHAYCAYPYEIRADFQCSSPLLDNIWSTSLRTMQLCTHETFEDCVHYEQMQYAGDTMITSKLAMLVSGDYRISKQALLQFDWSRLPEGLTQSRYPSRLLQVIPSWSLHWITAIKDYLLCSGDDDTVKSLLPGVSAVMGWFRRHTNAQGLPERLPYWNTTDWCPLWKRGQPPGWDSGPTCVIASQYVVAMRETAWLHSQFDFNDKALRLQARADQLAMAIHETFWSEQEGLYFDRPGGPEMSQYGNAWAILAGAADTGTRSRILERFPQDPALAPVSFFGWHAIFAALELCDDYARMPSFLGPWKEMLDHGLSTWAEENTYWRSLCHAWTAHPAIDFVTHILGIQPMAPGFASTHLRPHSCGLKHARGSACTPHGPIEVRWAVRGEMIEVTAEFPAAIDLHTPRARTRETTSAGSRRQVHFTQPR